jgi:hypothetical protein
MTSGHGRDAKAAANVAQEAKFYRSVADHARVWGLTFPIRFAEIVKYLPLKLCSQINHLQGNSQALGNPASSISLRLAIGLGEKHKDPDDAKSSLLEQGSGDRAIHPAAHRHHDRFFIRNGYGHNESPRKFYYTYNWSMVKGKREKVKGLWWEEKESRKRQ